MRKRIIYANLTYLNHYKKKTAIGAIPAVEELKINGVVFTEGKTHYKGILIQSIEELKFLGYKNK